MNVSDFLVELTNHGFQDEGSDQKMFVINDTIWDVDSREQWPYLQATINLNFDGVNPYPSNMPTDLKQVAFLSDTVTGNSIWPERVETIRARYADVLTESNEDPFSWYKWAGQLRLFPSPPASTGRFILDYFKIQPALTTDSVEADILLPARHHRVIVLGAVSKLYAMEDDTDNGKYFHDLYEERIQYMRNDLLLQQTQRPDQVFMIDSEDDPDYYPYIFP